MNLHAETQSQKGGGEGCVEEGSGVKSTCCSSRGLWFSSQHPYNSSQSSVIPIPGDQHPLLSGPHGHQVCVWWYTDIHESKTHVHIKCNKERWRDSLRPDLREFYTDTASERSFSCREPVPRDQV